MTYPLKEFIKEEVPYRLRDLHEIEVTDEEVEYIIDELWDDAGVMFNYNNLDNFLFDKLKEFRSDEEC